MQNLSQIHYSDHPFYNLLTLMTLSGVDRAVSRINICLWCLLVSAYVVLVVILSFNFWFSFCPWPWLLSLLELFFIIPVMLGILQSFYLGLFSFPCILSALALSSSVFSLYKLVDLSSWICSDALKKKLSNSPLPTKLKSLLFDTLS